MTRRRAGAASWWHRVGAAAAVLAFIAAHPPGAAQGDDLPGPVPPGQVLATAVHPFAHGGARTVSEQVPLVEVFTATWCPPCAPADRALDRLLDDESPGLVPGSNDTRIDLAVLQYHPVPDPGAEDPFGVPEGVDRLTRKHDAFWFPSVYVQGTMEDAPDTRSETVDAGMEQLFYNSYSNLIRVARDLPRPFVLTTESTIDDGNLTLDVTVDAERGVPRALYLQGVLWQDDVFFRGSNGIDTHRMTVLAMTGRQIEVEGLSAGETWTASWTMPVPKGLDVERAGMTVFVEAAWGHEPRDDSATLMMLAAGSATAATAAVVLMRSRPWRRQPTGRDGGGQ